jgi:hypothetical protein
VSGFELRRANIEVMDDARNSAVLGKAMPTGGALYEADELAWVEEQVALLRAGRFGELDLPNLIEELEEMARRYRREFSSRLVVLIGHLLKMRAQPRRITRSWRVSVLEQRRSIAALLDDSPSLRREIPERIAKAYPDAVKLAAAETGLPRSEFPKALPFTPEEILVDPEDADASHSA